MLETRISFLLENNEKVWETQMKLFSIMSQIQEVNEILTSVTVRHDLKIHTISDALYYLQDKGILSPSEAENLFQLIADSEYSYFQEFEKENAGEIERNYLGSSTFIYEYNNVNFFPILPTQYNQDYHYITLENEFDYYFNFSEAGLIKTILHLPLLEGEEEELHNIITDVEADTLISELFDDVETMLSEMEYAISQSLQAAQQIKIMNNFLKEYQTFENELQVLRDYLSDNEKALHFLNNFKKEMKKCY